jgi:uncharacterized protein YgiM (DUF1202 family)
LFKFIFRALHSGLFIILLALFSLPTSAQAQNATLWAAWLYRADGRLTRVALAGEQAVVVDEILLPLPASYDTYPLNTISVSPDGQRMAYLAGNATQSQQLVIYDHAQRNISALYDLTGNNGALGGMPVFSPDSSRLVFGYSLIGGGWEIIVIDVNSFSIIDTLRSDDPASVLAGVQTVDVVPYLHRYAADRVNFTLLPAAGSIPSRVDSWLWELPLRRVLPSPAFRAPDAAHYATTGEVIMALRDDRLPVGETLLMPDQANTLQVYDPNTDTLFPFYHDGTGEVHQPEFANNGAWIAFEAVTSEGTGWQLVNREGELVGSFGAEVEIEDLAPTPDGLIYLARDAATPTIKLYSLSADAEGAPGEGVLRYDSESDQPLEIVWVGDVSGMPLLGIPAEGEGQWAQLAPPLTGGSLVNNPTTSDGGGTPDVTPTPELTLRVGGTAVVNTSSGDSLNMRSDTGVQYQIRAKLERGTEVTVLDGPVNADGYNWWLVREPNGVEGWIVDFYGGQITLVPSSIFGTTIVDQMSEAAANPSMVSLLAVDDAVTVTLSDPRGSLRLRNGAGLSFRIISMLPNGTRLTVVEGPREADSLTWWQVRTPEGNVGWAAEIIESERALTKTGTVISSETSGTEEALVDTGVLAPPIIVSPLHGDVLTELPRTVVMEWSPVPGALSYVIEIEACPGVEENCAALPAITGVTEAQHSLNIPADGLYRWRVLAMGETMTTNSEWSTFIFDTE